MKLTKTAYVILGMLKLGRRTGYEIKSLIDVSARFFWAASYGQIYPELKRLEEAGLIAGEADESDGRRRRAYELTPTGEHALEEWLTAPDPLVREMRDEGVLKFFFAGALEPEEQLALVRRIRAEHERTGDELRSIRSVKDAAGDADDAAGADDASFPLLTLEWGIAFTEFNAEWCERMEKLLEARPARTGA